MTDQFTLDVVRDGALCGTITFEIRKGSEGLVLTVTSGLAKGLRAVAADYFAALSGLRRELGKDRLMPVCFGACLYVYPSGMSRDMSFGRSAYFLDRRRKASRNDLVDILDPLPAEISVETLVLDEREQAEFRKSLLEG